MSSIDAPLALVPEAAAIAPAPRSVALDARRHRRSAGGAFTPAPPPSSICGAENQLPWVDGLGITCVIALGGMVAMGWFDALLPSGVAIAAVAMSAVLVAGLAMRTRALPSLPRPDDTSGGPSIAESGGQRQPQARYQAVYSDGSASSPMAWSTLLGDIRQNVTLARSTVRVVRVDHPVARRLTDHRDVVARPDRRLGARPDRRVERAPLAAQVPVLSPPRAVLVRD